MARSSGSVQDRSHVSTSKANLSVPDLPTRLESLPSLAMSLPRTSKKERVFSHLLLQIIHERSFS